MRTMHGSIAPSLGLFCKLSSWASCRRVLLCLFICKCHWRLRSDVWSTPPVLSQAVPYCSLLVPGHFLVPSTALCMTGRHDILTTPNASCSMSSVYMEAAGYQAWWLCLERACPLTHVLSREHPCLPASEMVLEHLKVKNNLTSYNFRPLHPGVAPMLSAWISRFCYLIMCHTPLPCMFFCFSCAFLDFPTWA